MSLMPLEEAAPGTVVANDGRTNAKAMPGPVRLAVIADAYAGDVVFTTPPRWVQRLTAKLLAPIGRLLGRKAYDPRWEELVVEPRPETPAPPVRARSSAAGAWPMTAAVRRITTILSVIPLLALAAPADAIRLGSPLEPFRGNPANRLSRTPIDDVRYDPATRCIRAERPGMVAFTAWLDTHADGVSWGTYRCERWGRDSASLHAESRALDWHLDAHRAVDRAEAKRLITLLLAPDRAGNPQALARRMGVQEIIWACRYWSAGMSEFRPYSACEGKQGATVSDTAAHRDHIHFGMTKAGAMGRTSFWAGR